MTADLDPFFAALRQDADALPSGEPQAARRRGRHRSLRAVAGAAVGVLVLAGGITVAVRGGASVLPHPPTSEPSVAATATQFVKLAPVGPGVALGKAVRFGTATTIGDRAFVSSQTESGELSVTAIDLSAGKKVWGPRVIARFDDSAYVIWHPRYVIALGRHDNGSRPDGTIFVLAPDTGKELMHLAVDNFEADDIVLGESTLVLGSRVDHNTRGFDLATGQVRWTVPDQASGIVHSLPMVSSAGSGLASQRRMLPIGGSLAGKEFVQLTADGAAILRDLATGAEITRREKAVSTSNADYVHDETIAVDGVLYAATPAMAPTQIQATDLARPGTPRPLYAAEAGTQLRAMTSCGAARICFTENGQGEGQTAHNIVALDTGSGKVLWKQDGAARDLQVVGDRVLARIFGEAGAEETVILDGTGRQLLREESRAGLAAWLDPEAALIFRPSRDGGTIEVLGLSPLSGQPTSLGTVNAGNGCSWTATHLVCVTQDGIKVWRFAG